MKTHVGVFASVLLLGAQQAAALDQRYGAVVEILKFHDNTIFAGQGSAAGSGSYAFGGDASGAASFASDGLTAQGVDLVATGGIGVVAYIFDTLTFHVAGGGSAQVPVQMGGSWTAQGNGSKVSYSLSLANSAGSNPKTYEGYSFSNGVAESFVADVPVAAALVIDTGNYLTGVTGSYSVHALFDVVDGSAYVFQALVRADVVGSTSALIDDPLSIALPPGVTLTAASNSSYAVAAVPEPSTWFLMSVGLLGVGWLRRVRRRVP
jgi:hypothetical protein